MQVCPTGIDIRNGLQYECIGCAACIDGCDQVMDKMGYPPGLIRYTTENALARGYDAKAIWRRVLRPRTCVYAGVLLAIVGVTVASLAMKNPFKVDVIRDRGALAREAAPGVIENVYRMQLMNTDETPRQFTIRAEGLPNLTVVGVDQPVAVAAGQTRLFALRLQVTLDEEGNSDSGREREHPEKLPRDGVAPGTHKIDFTIQAVNDDKVVRHEQSSFIIPR